MLFFTAKLWQDINSEDYDTRQIANCKWEENAREYQRYFESIKHRIPKYIIAKLRSTNGFHDYLINGISIRRKNNRYVCRLELFDGDESFYLEMSGIGRIKISIESFENCILGELRWGYHEFRLTEANTLQLSILCDIDNELLFEFERVMLRQC